LVDIGSDVWVLGVPSVEQAENKTADAARAESLFNFLWCVIFSFITKCGYYRIIFVNVKGF
jgi:hypothetical protein